MLSPFFPFNNHSTYRAALRKTTNSCEAKELKAMKENQNYHGKRIENF